MNTQEQKYSGPFFDMHAHLDFASNAADAVSQLEELDAGAFAVSVLPTGGDTFGVSPAPQVDLSKTLLPKAGETLGVNPVAAPLPASAHGVRWGVGLHPWWVADGRADQGTLDTILAAIPTHTFIGEVGLDFSKKHVQIPESREKQREAFKAISRACAQVGGRVLSIHAVQSASDVLAILEKEGALDGCACIFHWYSGDSETFHKAVVAGAYFSVGSFMLQTKKGREYARQIPAKQLLLETDYPPYGQPYIVDAMQVQLAQTCSAIAQLRNADPVALAAQIQSTSATLLSLS